MQIYLYQNQWYAGAVFQNQYNSFCCSDNTVNKRTLAINFFFKQILKFKHSNNVRCNYSCHLGFLGVVQEASSMSILWVEI